jgi:ribosomal protein L4
LRRAFTDRVDAGEIIVVDKIADVCDENKVPKTKKMLAFLNAVAGTESVLLLDAEVEPEVALSIRNLQEALVLEAANVNTYLMLSFKKVVITKAGLEALGERLG